jgi:sugar phosphate isomerase/epimerase
LPELKIGIGLSSLRQPFKQALHTAASLGATGIEIDARNDLRPSELTDTGRRQLRKMLDDLNLRIAAIRFPTQRGYDVLNDLERRIDATKQAMKFAYSLGASVVINAIGYVPDDPQHPAYAQLQVSLRDLANYGHHVGAMLACETGSEPIPRLVGLLDSLGDQAIGISFNPASLVINDCYSEQSVQECASRILNVTARDAVRDLSRGRGIEVPLGRGSVDFPQVLGVLEEQHYRGWFIVDRLQATDAVAEIGQAIQFLKAL